MLLAIALHIQWRCCWRWRWRRRQQQQHQRLCTARYLHARVSMRERESECDSHTCAYSVHSRVSLSLCEICMLNNWAHTKRKAISFNEEATVKYWHSNDENRTGRPGTVARVSVYAELMIYSGQIYKIVILSFLFGNAFSQRDFFCFEQWSRRVAVQIICVLCSVSIKVNCYFELKIKNSTETMILFMRINANSLLALGDGK